MLTTERQNRWKGLVLGVLGGLAGVLAMRYYWKAVKQITGHDPRSDFDQGDVPDTDALDDLSLIGKHHRQGESTTAAMGRIVYQGITGEAPSQQTQTALSYLIHWLISMAGGGAYGALRTRAAVVDVPGGLALGGTLWLFGDEMAMSLAGLTKGPTAYPPELHAYSAGAHVAYGLAAAGATQLLYRLAP